MLSFEDYDSVANMEHHGTLWDMLYRATQDRQVWVESSNKMWSPGGGNGKPFQYFYLENPMNSMKRQKDMKREDEPPKLERVSNMLLGKSGEIATEKMKRLG